MSDKTETTADTTKTAESTAPQRMPMSAKKYDEIRGALDKFPLPLVVMYPKDVVDKKFESGGIQDYAPWFIKHLDPEKLDAKLLQAVYETYKLLRATGDKDQMTGFAEWLNHNGYIAARGVAPGFVVVKV